MIISQDILMSFFFSQAIAIWEEHILCLIVPIYLEVICFAHATIPNIIDQVNPNRVSGNQCRYFTLNSLGQNLAYSRNSVTICLMNKVLNSWDFVKNLYRIKEACKREKTIKEKDISNNCLKTCLSKDRELTKKQRAKWEA